MPHKIDLVVSEGVCDGDKECGDVAGEVGVVLCDCKWNVQGGWRRECLASQQYGGSAGVGGELCEEEVEEPPIAQGAAQMEGAREVQVPPSLPVSIGIPAQIIHVEEGLLLI